MVMDMSASDIFMLGYFRRLLCILCHPESGVLQKGGLRRVHSIISDALLTRTSPPHRRTTAQTHGHKTKDIEPFEICLQTISRKGGNRPLGRNTPAAPGQSSVGCSQREGTALGGRYQTATVREKTCLKTCNDSSARCVTVVCLYSVDGGVLRSTQGEMRAFFTFEQEGGNDSVILFVARGLHFVMSNHNLF